MKNFFLIYILFISYNLYSHNNDSKKIDSIYSNLYNYKENLQETEDFLLQMLKKKENKNLNFKIYFSLAKINYWNGNLSEALDYLNNLELTGNFEDTKFNLAEYLSLKGHIFIDLQMYRNALIFFKKAYEIEIKWPFCELELKA